MNQDQKQNQNLADAALKIAIDCLGKKEATGNNDGEFVNMVQEFVGGIREHGLPWCASFRSWCMVQTGLNPVTPKSDSSTWLYSYAKSNGLLLEKPIPGCTGLVKAKESEHGKTHVHTFAVIGLDESNGTVHSVDGNHRNMVEKAIHKISECDFMACV